MCLIALFFSFAALTRLIVVVHGADTSNNEKVHTWNLGAAAAAHEGEYGIHHNRNLGAAAAHEGEEPCESQEWGIHRVGPVLFFAYMILIVAGVALIAVGAMKVHIAYQRQFALAFTAPSPSSESATDGGRESSRTQETGLPILV